MDCKDSPPHEKKGKFKDALVNAFGFIFWGLGTLEYYGSRTFFQDLPLLLLGNGFERLCKCILNLESKNNEGRWLTIAELRQYGHNLECLFQKVIQKFPEQGELKELLCDGDTASFLSLLHEYNQGDRYYHFNRLCSIEETHQGEREGPAMKFEHFQDSKWVRTSPKEKYGKVLSEAEEFQPIWRDMIKKLERLIRGLSQLFTLGALGPIGVECKEIGEVEHFSDMPDEKLGTTSYADLLFPNHRSQEFSS
jgi:hypothetical protein